ncbi:hypothetical protein BDZ97DRAFT_1939327 [Flammula alnicola]|nr:hypothetical protein BDZ97DRAFT_1939327 [Flammula alnicola]
MSLVVIVNPVCGDSSAPSFFADHVLPLLHSNNVHTPISAQPHPLTVILGSGDGTLHEIINGICAAGLLDLHPTSLPPINFVLVPCGTANALYASLFPPQADADEKDPKYRLQSVQAFIDKKSPSHLSLASTTLSSQSSGPESPQLAISSVVVSTSLHASILHDSESLRDRYPGIERFKIAAQQNSSKWYRARVRLIPEPSLGVVQIYDPKSKAFISHPDSISDNPVVELDGPFAYFLSTVNIVILRPLRDPVLGRYPEVRSSFVPKTWKVLGGAYQDGAHVNLTYTQDGEIASNVDGPSVIEYIRCGGWEWIPDNDDQDAHLVCSDGAIFQIPKLGQAVCSIDAFQHAFSVYA